MSDELQQFLKYYLPHEDLNPILDKFQASALKKGRHLLKPGMDCSYLAYVQNGVFRVYYHDLDHKEVTTWFSFPEMIITDMLGFYTTGRAKFYVEAIEDSLIYKISKQDLESLYQTHPPYGGFGRKFAEEALTMLMERTMSLHTKSAEERYRELLSQPEFMQKIPLKHLASYLGITDTSLSRIRRSIR